MYLVHLGLTGPTGTPAVADRFRALILAEARPDDRVEHVTAHLPEGRLVIGVYLLAERLEEAEEAAAAVCRRVLALPGFESWRLVNFGVPLMAPYYEQLPDGPDGPDGPIGPGPVPSS